MDGSANPHDILHQGREGARQVPGRRDPGGLPPPGRAHQRQAHRDDRAPDAAQGARSRTVGDTDFLVGEQVDKVRFEEENERMEPRRRERRRRASRCCSASPRRRSRPRASSRRPPSRRRRRCSPRPRSGARRTTCRPQGERDHGPPDPGRDRPGPLPEHRGPDRGPRERRRSRAAAWSRPRAATPGRADAAARPISELIPRGTSAGLASTGGRRSTGSPPGNLPPAQGFSGQPAAAVPVSEESTRATPVTACVSTA